MLPKFLFPPLNRQVQPFVPAAKAIMFWALPPSWKTLWSEMVLAWLIRTADMVKAGFADNPIRELSERKSSLPSNLTAGFPLILFCRKTGRRWWFDWEKMWLPPLLSFHPDILSEEVVMVFGSSASSQRTGFKLSGEKEKVNRSSHPDLDQWPKIRDRTSHRNVFIKLCLRNA